MLLAQLMVTSLGNVGVLPLTGVTLPMLSWGRASALGATQAMAMVWLPLPGCVRSADGLPLSGLPMLRRLQSAVCQPGDNTALVATVPDDPALRQALVRLAAQQPVAGPVMHKGLPIPRRADLPTTLDAALQLRSRE